MDDESTFFEGVVAWICFHLGIIPIFLYALYLKHTKDREWNLLFGYLGKRGGLTFAILILIEIVILIIIFSIMMNRI